MEASMDGIPPDVPEKVRIDERTYMPESLAVGLPGSFENWASFKVGDVIRVDFWWADRSHNLNDFEVLGVEQDGDIITLKGTLKSGVAEIKFNKEDPLTARIAFRH
ncbi:MAG: hypothetical protein HYT40_00740 [Candidatus Sungbacteria bacterium]|uniref:Uncharacterized protein n=1 Tax=Candidatus Sungiibacteriota bacterium TaxID=2750080 RepID=A0A931SDG2_9BACT|nr:hypothetical protein [Candidatus Sungbacteria bacterium]